MAHESQQQPLVYNKASWAMVICLTVDIVSQAAAAEICIACFNNTIGGEHLDLQLLQSRPILELQNTRGNL